MHIQSLNLKNIRTFESSSLVFSIPKDEFNGFNVIVGENLSGKSTILKAILWSAFGRRIQDFDKPLISDEPAYSIFKRNAVQGTEFAIETEVFHEGRKTKLVYRRNLRRIGYRFEKGQELFFSKETERPILLHYPMPYIRPPKIGEIPAATKVMSDWDDFDIFKDSPWIDDLAETQRLFWKYTRMRSEDGRTWERRRQPFDTTRLDEIIFEFMNAKLGIGWRKYPRKDNSYYTTISAQFGQTPVHEIAFSDGFVSTFALLIDIFVRLSKTEGGVDSEGTILIDEIAGFMHPKWQMKLPGVLRRLFPNIQFILTTHSPFILNAIPSSKFFSVKLDGHYNAYVEDKSTEETRWSIESILDEMNMPNISPDFKRWEADFERLMEKSFKTRLTEDEEVKLKTIGQALAKIDSRYALLLDVESSKREDIQKVIREIKRFR